MVEGVPDNGLDRVLVRHEDVPGGRHGVLDDPADGSDVGLDIDVELDGEHLGGPRVGVHD